MHKNIISAATLAALVAGNVLPTVALAQERSPVRIDIGEHREEFREDMKERREEFKEKFKERISEMRKERIKNWLTRMQRRLGALIDRQYKLADKIQAKIERAAAKGKDVSVPRAKLAEARSKINAAKRALTDMTAQVQTILENNTPRDAFAKIHELQKGVFAKIREAHRALVEAAASLRGLGDKPTPTPSPTATP